ncbi:unnamed protein product [Prorocentrum cordatum]|uniref:Uncharacterized protein n=1 Tax=Prorocentrum cordatum TaxID=2364126 RepID=A0ABN9WQ19_9DINO|nr:unnamed protein product [Polarella glacialis]
MSSRSELEDFIRRCRLDHDATDALRSAGPDVQLAVLRQDDQGGRPLCETRHQSRVLMARLAAAREELRAGSGRPAERRTRSPVGFRSQWEQRTRSPVGCRPAAPRGRSTSRSRGGSRPDEQRSGPKPPPGPPPVRLIERRASLPKSPLGMPPPPPPPGRQGARRWPASSAGAAARAHSVVPGRFLKNLRSAAPWRRPSNAASGPKQRARRSGGRCTYHVLYWEAAEGCGGGKPGIEFGKPLGPRRDQTPELPCYCKQCDGAVDTWRFRLDATHATLRMIAKEGVGFREEVQEFICVSPRGVLEYDLHRFKQYNRDRKKNVLTENIVLGTPMQVEMGNVSPDDCGVSIATLSQGVGGEDEEDTRIARVCEYMREVAARVREHAAADGGSAALLVVHPGGVAVDSFGADLPFFAHSPEEPITRVVVLLAGPCGFGQKLLGRFEEALTGEAGCHAGPLRLGVPAARNSSAALGTLLMCHDRGALVPILEDVRLLGPIGWGVRPRRGCRVRAGPCSAWRSGGAWARRRS